MAAKPLHGPMTQESSPNHGQRDKYPAPSGRRRFVKGLVGASTVRGDDWTWFLERLRCFENVRATDASTLSTSNPSRCPP